jgi:peroxiredoxin
MMSLQSELEAFKLSWERRVGADVAASVALDNEALRQAGIVDRALGTGAKFPDQVLVNARGGNTRIYDMLARGPLIVTFYRGGWCPYCNLELRAYQAVLDEIRALGADLVAISPEAPDYSLSTTEKNGLQFEVLSDLNGALEDALGIRFDLSPAIAARFKRVGHDLPERNGDGRWSLPVPATYVVERGGTITLASVDPDYRKRLEPGAAIAALRALKTSDVAPRAACASTPSRSTGDHG